MYRASGGAPLHTTSTHALKFPGAPSFAPLFHAKGGDFNAGRWVAAASFASRPRYALGPFIEAIKLLVRTCITRTSLAVCFDNSNNF